ncbi:MAG: S8 family serine peptidase [Planctomycetota bacterium]
MARTFVVGDVGVRVGEDGSAAWRRGEGVWRSLRPVHGLLRFRARSFDPVRAPFEWPAELAAPAGTRLHLVQFHTQVLPVYRDALVAAGVELLQALPDNALYVRGDGEALRRVAALPCVRWIGPLQNGFKLDAATRAFVVGGGATPDVAGEAGNGVRDADRDIAREGRAATGTAWDCNLVLATKADRGALAERVAAVGGVVVDLAPGSTMLRARLTAAQLSQLLAGDLVVYADRDGGSGEDMDNARVQTGANHVESLAGYRGNGVRVEIAELFDQSHPDFNNLPNRVLERSAGALSHGHCTAGIVGGCGANNPAARGMMDQCTMIDGGYYNTADHFVQLQGSVQAPWWAMQVTASWGGGQLTTDYTTVSQALDDALFYFDVPRTQSQSNDGTQLSRPEAWAKNGISVGAVIHNDNADPSDDIWGNSASIGPAADGRLKPDLVAYDEAILTSDRPGVAGYNPNPGISGDYYAAFGGTSGATPIVNGCLGIVQEMFTDGAFGNPLPLPPTPANRFANRPHMTTARALLCNTAAQYDFSGLTHDLTRSHQGWGMPSLSRLYDHRRDLVVLDEYDVLQLGDRRRYLVHVAPGTPELRVTVVWSDPAGNPAASVQLIDDLDLTVTRWSDGELWHGNHGLDVGTSSLSGGAADTVDNVECVYLAAPTPGLYLVDVTAASILQDEHLETPQLDVDFALAMHPMGGGYRTPGTFDLDVSAAAPGDLGFSASNVPATGWTEGFLLLSLSTERGRGFGAMFGLEPDALTGLVLGLPAVAGDAFHFVNAPGAWPFVAYQFPDPGLISALSGVTVDAVVVLLDGAEIAAVSDVERRTLQ